MCFPVSQIHKPTIIQIYISKKVDHHTGGNWLIHGTKRHKDDQFQSPGRIS